VGIASTRKQYAVSTCYLDDAQPVRSFVDCHT
jgi:hypothetical protein